MTQKYQFKIIEPCILAADYLLINLGFQNLTMIDYNKNYEEAYQTLNAAQKQAVQAIEGPVMVVAGPGTGKTQLLAARIGYILKSTDVKAHNILCMTFTDAGVLAMRKRLLSFIGPEAYNVNLYTYHGFCNMVIQDNLELFGNYLDLSKLTDLEQVDVYRELIDAFANDHPLKKLKGDLYYDKRRLSKLFQIMKEENWTAEHIEEAVKELEVVLKDDPDYIYKRAYTDRKTKQKFQKGDIKLSKLKKDIAKYDNTIIAAKEFKNYLNIMAAKKRYDYQDMILWTIEKFQSNPDLLADYQERYQYILVDEYQDTNGSQNELIYLLASYWDNPNLFVVGDDDQSIFRFQGANMDNIVDFKKRFDPETIVLEQNYRSGQHILDKSTLLIQQNVERLANTEKEITKNLIESRKEKAPGVITYTKYHNTVHEEKGIINAIIELRDSGYPLQNIAIIYRKHKNVENIIKYLEINDVPLNVKRKIDVLQMPMIQQLISILNYLFKETEKPSSAYSGDHLLFEILHFSFFEISPKEIAKISIQLYQERSEIGKQNRALPDDAPKIMNKRWRDIISDKEWLDKNGIGESEAIVKFAKCIEQWIQDSMNVTIQVLLEKIITESTMLDDLLGGSNSTFKLQVLNTFFEFVKAEATSEPRLDLKLLLDIIEKMESNSLTIPFNRIVHANDGVNFITAHSAKGLEFEKVFIIRCEQENWVDTKFNRNDFSMPKTLVLSSALSDIEDDRRLFFVAMTRAKDEVHISYPLANEEGKEKDRAVFISELIEDENEIKDNFLPDEEIMLYKADLLRFRQGQVQLIDHNLIDLVLENYIMSVTNLNKYLKCPVSFYYEVILRVPQARTPYLGFGNAVHRTLQQLFLDIEESPERLIPPLDIVVEKYEQSLEYFRQHFTEKEFLNYLEHGRKIMKGYYESHVNDWTLPRKYEVEYKVRNVEHAGVPIKGDLDKVVYHDDHFYVVDYKTGKYDSKKFKPPTGGEEDEIGDLWRQIVFYKILVNADPHFTKPMQYGMLDFVEPKDDKYNVKKIEVEDFEIEHVTEELVATWKGIHNHEFEKGCEDEKCRWCNFVADHLNKQV